MANSIAIAKAEELLERLRADDGSPATRAVVLRQLEEIRISVQQPPEAMGYYTNKVSTDCRLDVPGACVDMDTGPHDGPHQPLRPAGRV